MRWGRDNDESQRSRRSASQHATNAMRFVRALVLAATFAAVVTPDSLAVRFADAPCPEAGAGGPRSCPAGVVGNPYVVRLTGEGGCGPDPNIPGSGLPYQFRLLNGSLPPGLSLEKDGILGRIPTKAGRWSFWLELSDENPPSASWCLPKKSEREFTVQVGAPRGTTGVPYAVEVILAGVGLQTWSIASGTLPPGLALGSTTGMITGTPAIAGSFPVKLSAMDSRGGTATFDLTIIVDPKLAFRTTRLSRLKVGRSYHAIVRTSGGIRPVKLGLGPGRLPVGIRFNPRTGVLSGKPRKAGVYRVTIEARDGLGRTAKKMYVLTVQGAPGS